MGVHLSEHLQITYSIVTLKGFLRAVLIVI